MPDAIAYGRFSPRPNAEEVESIDTQRSMAFAYAAMTGLTIVDFIGDPETSARTTPLHKRAGGAALLAAVGPSQVKHVIAYRLDRMFRAIEDGLATMKLWHRQGVSLHLVAEAGCALNTGSAFGRMMVGQRLLMAEFEADITSERTRDAMQRHQAKGRRMSAKVCYGQMLDPSSPPHKDSGLPTLTIDNPAEQAVIERLKLWEAQGVGLREMARALNSEGVTKRGGRWDHTTIKRILDRAAREAQMSDQARQ